MRHQALSARFMIALLLLALLAGCGMARMAYNNGEALSYMWLDRYVAFTDQQRQWVQPEISLIFDWHRRTQLPDYIELLEKAQRRVHRPVTEAEIRADADEMRRRLLLIVERSLPALADLALSLRPEQILHLENKFIDNNDGYRRDNLRGDIEKRQRDRYRKALKQAEYFFGNLNGAQERRLRALSDARPLNNELVLMVRLRRQQEMLATLQRIQAARPDKEATIEMLRDYVKRSQDYFGNEDHKAFYEAYQAGTIHQVTALLNGTTAAQKRHFEKLLEQWIADFRRLSGA